MNDECEAEREGRPSFFGPYREQMRYLHSIESAPGWVYRTRVGTVESPGAGWELNIDEGDGGYSVGTEADGTVSRRSHWRAVVRPD